MYCRDCGQLISNDSLKCTNCGTRKGLGDNYCYRCGSRIKSHSIEVCEFCGAKLNNNIETKINKEEMNLKNLGSLLHNLSPLRTLDRGYSIINKEDVVVNSVLKVSENDEIEVVLSDGSLDCTVNKINKKEG